MNTARTARKQVPAIFKKISWVKGTRNLDIGGGPYDDFTMALAKKGVKNYVYDAYNRSKTHNSRVLNLQRPFHTVTLSNVLNVVKSRKMRIFLLWMANSRVAENGAVYITVYEGDGSGRGKKTRDGWQANRKLKSYLAEVKRYFHSAKIEDGMIVAKGAII